MLRVGVSHFGEFWERLGKHSSPQPSSLQEQTGSVGDWGRGESRAQVSITFGTVPHRPQRGTSVPAVREPWGKTCKQILYTKQDLHWGLVRYETETSSLDSTTGLSSLRAPCSTAGCRLHSEGLLVWMTPSWGRGDLRVGPLGCLWCFIVFYFARFLFLGSLCSNREAHHTHG